MPNTSPQELIQLDGTESASQVPVSDPKKRRAVHRRFVTIACQQAECRVQSEPNNIVELNLAYNNVSSKLNSLCELDRLILEGMFNNNCPEDEFITEQTTVDEYTNRARRILAKIDSLTSLASSSVSNVTENATSNFTRLPKIELPKFGGDPFKFVTFKECFNAAIDNNNSLSNIQRFTYLKSLLFGQAAKAVDGLSLTEANYTQAWTILDSRFGSRPVLIASHMHEIVNAPKAHDSSSLKKLYETCEINIRGLENLKIVDKSNESSQLLAPLLMSKITEDLMVQWNKSRNSGEEFDLWALLEFIRKEVESRERFTQISQSPSTSKSSSNNQLKPNPPTTSLINAVQSNYDATVDVTTSCPLCHSGAHKFVHCRKFIESSLEQRNNIVWSMKLCRNCLSPNHSIHYCHSTGRCVYCHLKHSSLLHNSSFRFTPNGDRPNGPVYPGSSDQSYASPPILPTSNQPRMNQSPLGVKQTSSNPGQQRNNSNRFSYSNQAVLSTIKLRLIGPKGEGVFRCFLDGGSEASYIKEDVAIQLGLPVVTQKSFETVLFGGVNQFSHRSLYSSQLSSMDYSTNLHLNLWSCPRITTPLSSVPGDFSSYGLSDDLSLGEREIHVLIGADYYYRVIHPSFQRLTDDLVVLDTLFGRTLHGNLEVSTQGPPQTSRMNFIGMSDRFALESIGIDVEEISSFSHPKPKIVGNRLEVKLPWLNDSRPGDNSLQAYKRHDSLINKMSPTQEFEYDKYIKDLLDSDVVQVVHPPLTSQYFLPHHGVFKNGKLRVVFDGGSKDSNGQSINSLLHKGDNLLPLIPIILSQFRFNEFPLTNDLKAAFLQLRLDAEDQQYVKFIWKNSCYQFKRVLFGITSSPYLLNSSIQFLLCQWAEKFPLTVSIILASIYCDDFVASVTSEEIVEQVKREASIIFNSVSFELKEWQHGYSDTVQNVLGISWHQDNDSLSINVQVICPSSTSVITRRVMLSSLSTLYDPLNLLSCWEIICRIAIQETWTLGLDWDEPVPSHIAAVFTQFVQEAKEIKDVSLPRKLRSNFRSNSPLQVFVFCDSSSKAMAACAYLYDEESNECSLIISRMKVVPIKSKLSIPRLELVASLIGIRLAKFLQQSEVFKSLPFRFFSDSEIVLAWLRQGQSSLKLFESRRVEEILSISNCEHWYHIPSDLNPADLPTRGVSLYSIPDIWWKGPNDPSSLLNRVSSSKSEIVNHIQSKHDTITVPTAHSTNALKLNLSFLLTRSNCYTIILRILAVILLFTDSCRKIQMKSHNLIKSHSQFIVSQSYRDKALLLIIRYGQMSEFMNEYLLLQSGKSVPHSSRLSILKPLFKNGVIYIQTRLGEVLPLLSSNCEFFKVIVNHFHAKVYHGSCSATLAELLSHFYIIKSRQKVKSVLKNCYNCKLIKYASYSTPESPLPEFRTNQCLPFSYVGIDFLGPFICENKKTYILLFTCSVIRAVHLELTLDLSAEQTKLAVRRFISRRGCPIKIFSDNARTFQKIQRSEIESVEWEFLPPYGSWFAGFYERLVGVVKTCLKTTLVTQSLSVIEMSTVLCEVEEVVNKRPLYYIAEDDLILTPNHFLRGIRPPNCTSDDVQYHEFNLVKRWKHVNKVSRDIWSSFLSKYLVTLRNWNKKRLKGPHTAPKPGDVVLVHDKSVPRFRWPRAKVLELNSSGRIAKLKFPNNVSSRPVALLHQLEMSEGEN